MYVCFIFHFAYKLPYLFNFPFCFPFYILSYSFSNLFIYLYKYLCIYLCIIFPFSQRSHLFPQTYLFMHFRLHFYFSVCISTSLRKWGGLAYVSHGCQLFPNWLIDIRVRRSTIMPCSNTRRQDAGREKTLNITFENYRAQESHGWLQQMLGVWTLARDGWLVGGIGAL